MNSSVPLTIIKDLNWSSLGILDVHNEGVTSRKVASKLGETEVHLGNAIIGANVVFSSRSVDVSGEADKVPQKEVDKEEVPLEG